MSDSVDGILGETVDRVFAEYVGPALLASAERGDWPSALWDAIEEIGLAKALLPDEAGGFGVPVGQALRLLRRAGGAALPVPLAETMLAGWLLAGAGLALADGPLTVAAGMSVSLDRAGAGWRLQGQAAAVPWGRNAVAVALMVVRNGQAFVAAVPGHQCSWAPGTNIAGEPRDRLRLDVVLPDDAVAPAASRIGMAQLRAAGAATRSLMIAGALQRVSDMTVAYATERKQFGRPIGRFQAVQQSLAVLAGEAAAAFAASEFAADGFAEGVRLSAIAVGKARSSEAAGIGAAIAHQVHGAIGFTREHGLHFLTKRLWAWRDEFGTESEWSHHLGMQAAARRRRPALGRHHRAVADRDGHRLHLRTPTPSPAAERLRSEVREFLASEVATRQPEQRAESWNGFDAGFSRKMGQRGWIGITWPKTYGGSERSPLERYVILEEVLAAGAPVAAHWIADRQSGPSLLRYGTEAQRQAILPRIAAGECFFCIGMSEPDSGSDLASVRTRATKVQGGWVVNGTKLWTTNGHLSHYMILFCRTGAQDERQTGTSQFVVDLSLPGITIRPVLALTGEHHFNEIVFQDAFLSEDSLLGEAGKGWDQVMGELAYERSGPERFLSSFALLVELVRVLGHDPSERASIAIGRLVARIATLRRMSRSVAGMLAADINPSLQATMVKDLGALVEQEIPEVARSLMPPENAPAGAESYVAVLAYLTLHAPSFSLRGGTREILRGIIARGLGLR